MANYEDDTTELLKSEDESGASLGEKPMAFFDHLEELRWTLVKSGSGNPSTAARWMRASELRATGPGIDVTRSANDQMRSM